MLTEQFKTTLFVILFAILVIFGIILVSEQKEINGLYSLMGNQVDISSKIIKDLTPTATPSATPTKKPVVILKRSATESAK